ncbi:MAG TPA: diguanylate cyclase [Kofleriaceae bacterium]|nr:diguanylate cyclase [Kofleriaceae bacterium]
MFKAVVISDAVASPDLIVASVDLVSRALLDAGCTDVERVSSIEHGLSLVNRLQAAVIILDLLEPLRFEGYRRILARSRGVPVIVIVPENKMQTAFDAGVDDCVARPIRRVELVARTRAAIRVRIERARRSKRDRRLSQEVRTLQREKHDLERIVCVDSLTGVANRRHSLSLLEAEWKRSAREGTPMSLIIIDLDCFHAFNETYGHPGGDACLRRVTAEMVMCLRRPSDFLGRYGGEEFIAVLANTDAAGACIVAERLRAAVEAIQLPHISSTCAHVVTISVGFATATPQPDATHDALVSAADDALLAAKSHGRNRINGEAAAHGAVRHRMWTQPFRRFPPVVADPWFANRIPQFLAAARGELLAARDACESGGFDRIRATARKLRGNANDHGIETIAELANLLERAARTDDRASIKAVVDELEQYVEHVQVTYRRPLERKLGHVG